MLRNTETAYGSLAKWLHWVTAVLVIAMLAVGIWMAGLDDENPLHDRLVAIHKPTGVLVLLITLLRLVWLAVSRPPPLPAVLAGWEKALTRGVAVGFYALLVALPVVGLAMSDFADKPVSFFGLFTMPEFFDKDFDRAKALLELHEILAFVLIGLLVLHVAGTVKHRYFDPPEADVLKRIV